MRPASRRVLLVTRQWALVVRFREVLRQAGFPLAPKVILPPMLPGALAENPGCLALIDGSSAVSWRSLAAVRPDTPDSLLVLCSRKVTPQLVQAALESGLDGVISVRLPVEEAAQALLAICGGERQFRFQPPAAVRMQAPAAPAPDEFDEAWMFGS
jgi:DNA-binding NarL/FixJ family response regulator